MAKEIEESANQPLEHHPFEPFVPEDARVLIMGTFPPKSVRWAMNFYYPNRINDFWRIMGVIFYNDKDRFYDVSTRKFHEDEIKAFLREKGIALSDTGAIVRRLRDNASDKYLEIIEPVDLAGLLNRMPNCITIATTGEKAAEVLAELTDSEAPKMGESIIVNIFGGRNLQLWRMPSTSRAYPLALEKKADYYRRLFESAGLI